mmetsp:Transcript_22807/g.67355  ORF Transcript_22807/g.67355 Transcript_22807/m.67355 type:complete len:95 (+) Transcript_22807:223-507(+)
MRRLFYFPSLFRDAAETFDASPRFFVSSCFRRNKYDSPRCQERHRSDSPPPTVDPSGGPQAPGDTGNFATIVDETAAPGDHGVDCRVRRSGTSI